MSCPTGPMLPISAYMAVSAEGLPQSSIPRRQVGRVSIVDSARAEQGSMGSFRHDIRDGQARKNPPFRQGECHGHTGNVDDAARHGNSGQHVERKALGYSLASTKALLGAASLTDVFRIFNRPTHLGWIVRTWKAVFSPSKRTGASVEDLLASAPCSKKPNKLCIPLGGRMDAPASPSCCGTFGQGSLDPG